MEKLGASNVLDLVNTMNISWDDVRYNLTIRFDASAPGGQALVRSAVRAIDAGRSFVLPRGWLIVGVATKGKVKTLRLKFIGDEDIEALRSYPTPPQLSAEAALD